MMSTHYGMDFKQSMTICEKCYGIDYNLLKCKGNRETRIENIKPCLGVTELLEGSIKCLILQKVMYSVVAYIMNLINLN